MAKTLKGAYNYYDSDGSIAGRDCESYQTLESLRFDLEAQSPRTDSQNQVRRTIGHTKQHHGMYCRAIMDLSR